MPWPTRSSIPSSSRLQPWEGGKDMSSRFARKVSILVLGVAVLGFALTVSGLAFARPAALEKVPEKIAAQDEPRHASDAQGKEKEADPEEALRHSPSVKLIAKVTGLDVAKAYWLSIA